MTPLEHIQRRIARAVSRNESIIVYPEDRQDLIDAFTESRRQGAEEFRKRAVEALKKQQQDFLSNEYALNQPISSISERFACGCCIEAIEALPLEPENTE